MKNFKRINLALLVFILTIGNLHLLCAIATEVEITYTGNEGFMIVVGGKKILIDAFTKYYKNFEKIGVRLKGFAPEEGKRIPFSHEGIDITMILLHHGRNRKVKVTNLGFLFSLGGKRFFHMGDSEIVLSELNIYNLPEEKIDVAFVPYWYFTSNKYKPALLEGIGAEQVIPMHLILVDGGPQERERILESISAEFPEAILFSEEMEKKIIQ